MSAHKKTASFKGFAHHWLALSLSVDDKWHWKWQHGVREEAERGRLWGNQCNRKFWLNVCSYLQENSETMPLFEGLICLRLTYRRNMYYRTKTRLLTMIYSRSWAPLFRLLLFFSLKMATRVAGQSAYIQYITCTKTHWLAHMQTPRDRPQPNH